LKAPPAKLHHAATDVDREDDPAPGIRVSAIAKVLDSATAIRRLHHFSMEKTPISKLKQLRRVATRFEKTARNYLAVVTLAATILCIR
jgi:hypothetical protein